MLDGVFMVSLSTVKNKMDFCCFETNYNLKNFSVIQVN